MICFGEIIDLKKTDCRGVQMHFDRGIKTIFPYAPGSMTLRWACAASDNGNLRSTTGPKAPLSMPAYDAAWILEFNHYTLAIFDYFEIFN